MSDYLSVTHSDVQMADLISDKIRTYTPFSLTRFGDGEIYFLNKTVPNSLKIKVCELWGYKQSEFEVVSKRIEKILFDSLRSTDALGLLDKTNPICKQLSYSEQTWSIKKDYFKKLRSTLPIICDHQLPRNSLFGNTQNFKKILGKNSVTIISPNVEKLKQNNISQLLDVDVHYVLSSNNREKLFQDIEFLNDFVVLYGTSIFAKDLGIVLKNQAKLCLDYGATLDAWAGIPSRKWFVNGVQSHCFISNKENNNLK